MRAVSRFLTRILSGRDPKPASFLLSRWLFLRLLGAVFLIAFVSYWVQLDGLIGSRGLLPASDYLDGVARNIQGSALDRFLRMPTVCWINTSDTFLHALCGAGTAFSVLLIVGMAPAWILFLLWLTYLSLVVVGQTFFSFQWDILLLETAFCSLFLAPLGFLPGLRRERPPLAIALWLERWLLFKLMFLSGLTKLLSGDETWWRLSGVGALPVHYETQPLPTWVGWYTFHLPAWFHHASLVSMFIIEVGVPFLLFAPRRLRHLGCAAMLVLQLIIAITGNYTFFNLLTMTLCVLHFDDRFLGRFVPRRLKSWVDEARPPRRRGWVRSAFLMPVALSLLFVSALTFVNEVVRTHQGAARQAEPTPFTKLLDQLSGECETYILSWARPGVFAYTRPFRTVSGYGLFRVMTTERPEIVVEGSDDGVTWKEYEFEWKAGALDRRPSFVAPHQPRLDWQMWFAGLNPRRHFYWLERLATRLLEGSAEVIGLLGTNPFAEKPPRYVRLVYYKYRFTDPETKSETGNWWRRDSFRALTRPISLPARQESDR